MREPAEGLPYGRVLIAAKALTGRSTCEPAVREVGSEAERPTGVGAGKVVPEPAW
jgi:hypothetical protein